ncbi:hypothetical protein [Rhodanobacter lindaniclasticus]
MVVAGGTLDYARMMTGEGLRDVASYADAIGPDLRAVIPWNADGSLGLPTRLVHDAHAVGSWKCIRGRSARRTSCLAGAFRQGRRSAHAQPVRPGRADPRLISTPASMRSSPTIRPAAGRRSAAR